MSKRCMGIFAVVVTLCAGCELPQSLATKSSVLNAFLDEMVKNQISPRDAAAVAGDSRLQQEFRAHNKKNLEALYEVEQLRRGFKKSQLQALQQQNEKFRELDVWLLQRYGQATTGSGELRSARELSMALVDSIARKAQLSPKPFLAACSSGLGACCANQTTVPFSANKGCGDTWSPSSTPSAEPHASKLFSVSTAHASNIVKVFFEEYFAGTIREPSLKQWIAELVQVVHRSSDNSADVAKDKLQEISKHISGRFGLLGKLEITSAAPPKDAKMLTTADPPKDSSFESLLRTEKSTACAAAQKGLSQLSNEARDNVNAFCGQQQQSSWRSLTLGPSRGKAVLVLLVSGQEKSQPTTYAWVQSPLRMSGVEAAWFSKLGQVAEESALPEGL